ncbi:peptide deformylase [Thalassobius sp. MITS945101]|uniref:peptide deformylase n=1 Tax=Thalassobius sp. MITS945101 TaxID=3096994 RepID=UPI00399962B7
MAVRQVLLWPDPRLTQVCAPVEAGVDLTALAADMLDTMYDANGRGLAGPQIGVMQRIFVMDITWKEGLRAPQVLINPEIVAVSEVHVGGEEGCLSIPDTPLEVTRPAEVTMRWRDMDGLQQERRMTGFEAKCAQHELDHLNGKVIFDHLPEDERRRYEAAYLEAQQ